MSFFEKRPQDLLRLLFSKERTNALAKVKDHCRTLKLPYRLLETEDLNKVAASVHHEGIVMVVRPMEEKSTYSLLKLGVPKDPRTDGFVRLRGVVDPTVWTSNKHSLGHAIGAPGS